MNVKETKRSIIQAGQKAVEELIKVAKEEDMLDDKPKDDTKKKSEFKGFAEGRAKFE